MGVSLEQLTSRRFNWTVDKGSFTWTVDDWEFHLDS